MLTALLCHALRSLLLFAAHVLERYSCTFVNNTNSNPMQAQPGNCFSVVSLLCVVSLSSGDVCDVERFARELLFASSRELGPCRAPFREFAHSLCGLLTHCVGLPRYPDPLTSCRCVPGDPDPSIRYQSYGGAVLFR
jgi:hypothetical protein